MKLKLFKSSSIEQIDINRIIGGSGEPGEWEQTEYLTSTQTNATPGGGCHTDSPDECGDTYPSDC